MVGENVCDLIDDRFFIRVTFQLCLCICILVFANDFLIVFFIDAIILQLDMHFGSNLLVGPWLDLSLWSCYNFSLGCLLFRIKHPCNLGSWVTNLLLTCRQSSWKENRKKILTYMISNGWSKLDLLSLHSFPKLLGTYLFTCKEKILQVISHAYIY